MPAGVTFSTALADPTSQAPFPIGGGNADTTCQRFVNCSSLAPLIVCTLSTNDHSSHDTVVDPGWPAFLQLFSTPPLLTP
jgi:hypothetical protein